MPECCKAVAAEYEGKLGQAGEHIHGLELELRQKRSVITQLQNQLADKDKTHKLRGPAEEVFQEWKKVIAPNARAFTGKRLKNVLDRLGEGKDDVEARVLELKEAIHGAKVGAFENPKTGVRYDDLELICRDDTNVRRFRQFYLAALTKPEVRPRQRQVVRNDLPKPPNTYAPPISWVLYRVEMAGEWWVEREGGFYFFPCPEHPNDGALALAQVFGSPGHTWVRLSCIRDCDEGDIMDGYNITELFSLPGAAR
jgi:hypothetical protein